MKTIRNKLFVVLTSLFVACLALFFTTSFVTAKANEIAVNKDCFVMVEGAQASLNKDGLRFRVQMGENVYNLITTNDNLKLHVYIAPVEYFEAVGTDYASLEKKVEIVFDDESKLYQNGDYYYANAALFNLDAENNDKITESQFEKEFAAVGCIVEDGETITRFTDGGINNVRSQYQVLQSAVLSVENEEHDFTMAEKLLDEQTSPYKNWFGTEEYPVEVDNAEDYAVLQEKVSYGLTTNANFEVNNKFDISNRDNLPANTNFYHYVTFVDTGVVHEVVRVKEGDTAAPTTLPVNNTEEVEYHNSLIYGYYLNNWLTTEPSETSKNPANLTNISRNMSVYALWAKTRIEDDLLNEASAKDPSIALFFGERFGFTQLKSSGNSSSHTFTASNRAYHPNMEYDGFKGMTSYTVIDSNKDARMIFNIEAAPHFTYAAGDYVMFYVYVELNTTSQGDSAGRKPTALIRCNNDTNSGVWCAPDTWTKVVFPVEEFLNKSNTGEKFYLSFGAFFCNPTARTDDYTYYISNVKRISGDDVMRLSACHSNCVRTHSVTPVASDCTYNLGGGDVSLIGQVGVNVWGSNYTYVGEIGSHVYYANGSLLYNEIELPISGHTTRQIDLTFKNTVSGKIYVVARGFATDGTNTKPKIQVFNEENAHKGDATVTDLNVQGLDDGYKVWELDLGSIVAKKIRLFGYARQCSQIEIVSISTTNPYA